MSPLHIYRGTAYRYRGFKSFDDKEKGRIERMFSLGELNFSNPIKFNDPFECNPSTTYKPAELRKYFEKLAQKNHVKLESQNISNVMQSFKEQGFNVEYQKHLGSSMGICCMSQEGDIVTQWAYTLKMAKGFVLNMI